MPPRVQGPKGSIGTKNASASSSKLTSMPPPPDPPIAHAILEPEATALSACLKNAAVKTGQIYGFYADMRRLGIETQVPKPPKSLTAALGREIEKYDQLVDSIESHLLRAIAVLQRDMMQKERRIKLAEEASIVAQTRSEPHLSSGDSLPVTNEPHRPQKTTFPTPTSSPPAPTSSGIGRRPSAISISSLHRQPFPLKLDLSSSALRFSAEETSMFSSGLASPVTLAPKSARAIGPNEYPPDLMAFVSSNPVLEQPVDIYLTGPNDDTIEGGGKLLNVGNTAEKPIELDLDAMDIDIAMTNLFGGSANTETDSVDLFPPMAVDRDVNPADINAKTGKMESSFLETLECTVNDDDIFASLDVSGSRLDGTQTTNDQTSEPVPSPATLLFASLDPASQLQGLDGSASNVSDAPFDLGLEFSNVSPSFFGNPPDPDVKFPMEMDQLLAMGTSDGKEAGVAHADKKSDVGS